MSNRDFEEWFMREIADDEGDYNKPVYEAAKWAWQARVPEGYVVVPKEPTDEMISKAQEETPHFYHGDSWYGTEEISEGQVISCYKAMIESEK